MNIEQCKWNLFLAARAFSGASIKVTASQSKFKHNSERKSGNAIHSLGSKLSASLPCRLCSAVFTFWKENLAWFVNALLQLLMVD